MLESIGEWLSYDTNPFEDIVIVMLIVLTGTQVMSFWCGCWRGR